MEGIDCKGKGRTSLCLPFYLQAHILLSPLHPQHLDGALACQGYLGTTWLALVFSALGSQRTRDG